MICIEDFCGRWGHFYPVQWWADYDPANQTVYFGGEWADIPDWQTPQPAITDLYNHIGQFLPEFAGMRG